MLRLSPLGRLRSGAALGFGGCAAVVDWLVPAASSALWCCEGRGNCVGGLVSAVRVLQHWWWLVQRGLSPMGSCWDGCLRPLPVVAAMPRSEGAHHVACLIHHLGWEGGITPPR